MSPIMIALLAGAAANEPMSARGKWQVDYGDSRCTLARAFGERDRAAVFGISATPLSKTYDVKVQGRATSTLRRGQVVTITIGEAPPVQKELWAVENLANGQRRLSFSVEPGVFVSVPDPALVRIDMADGTSMTLRADRIQAGLAALNTCKLDLAKTWGIEPGELDQVVTPPVSVAPETWLAVNDYPSASLSAHEAGMVSILWKVGADRRASECRVIASSGFPRLDAAACRAVMLRARYTSAALDASGKPIASHASRTVKWTIPQ